MEVAKQTRTHSVRFPYTRVVLHESIRHHQSTTKREYTPQEHTCCGEENGGLWEGSDGVGRGTCVTLTKHERTSDPTFFRGPVRNMEALFIRGRNEFVPAFQFQFRSRGIQATRTYRKWYTAKERAVFALHAYKGGAAIQA